MPMANFGPIGLARAVNGVVFQEGGRGPSSPRAHAARPDNASTCTSSFAKNEAASNQGRFKPSTGRSETEPGVDADAELKALRRKSLTAPPSLRLEIGPPPITRKVDRLSCVRFASVRYSVPVRYIGRAVTLIQVDARLVIVAPSSGEILVEHSLAQPGTASVLGEHYDGARPAPNRGPRSNRLLSNSSAYSKRARSNSWSAPRQSATLGCPTSSRFFLLSV